MRLRRSALLAVVVVALAGVPSVGAVDPPDGSPHLGVLVESPAFAIVSLGPVDAGNDQQWRVFAYHGSDLHPTLAEDEMRLLMLRRTRATLASPVSPWRFVADEILPAGHLVPLRYPWGFFRLELNVDVEGVGAVSLLFTGNPPGLSGIGCPPVLLMNRGHDMQGEMWESGIGNGSGTIGEDSYEASGSCNEAWGWGASGYALAVAGL